jgi:hypothetical protein
MHEEKDELWLKWGRPATVDGQTLVLYPIRSLAWALGRSTYTIRRWEAQGIIPRATYRLSSSEPNLRRRRYSAAQIRGLVSIAEQHGWLDRARPTSTDGFTAAAVGVYQDALRV